MNLAHIYFLTFLYRPVNQPDNQIISPYHKSHVHIFCRFLSDRTGLGVQNARKVDANIWWVIDMRQLLLGSTGGVEASFFSLIANFMLIVWLSDSLPGEE